MRKIRYLSVLCAVLLLSSCGESSNSVAVNATTTPSVIGSSLPYESSLDDVSLGSSDELNKIAKNLNLEYSGTDVGGDFTKALDNVRWDDSSTALKKIEKQL